MKVFLTLIVTICSVNIWAQKKDTPKITLIEKLDSIPALKVNDDGLRMIEIPVIVNGGKKNPRAAGNVSFKVKLIDYENARQMVELKNDGEASIVNYLQAITIIDSSLKQPKFKLDSTKWTATAACFIQLNGPAKPFYIVTEENTENAVKVVVFTDTPSTKKITATTDTANLAAQQPVQTGKTNTAIKTDNAVKTAGAVNNIFTLEDSVSVLDGNYKKGTIKLDTVDIRITRAGKPGNTTDKVNFIAEKKLFPFDIKLQNNSILIDSMQWRDTVYPAHKKDTIYFKDTFLIFNNNYLAKTLTKSSPTAYIRITGDSTTTHGIVLAAHKDTSANEYTPDVPFWAEIGTNFDLIDKVQAQNIYGGIFGFIRDARLSKNKLSSRWSFIGGVYESKSTSLTSTSDSGLIYRDGKSFIKTPKGYPYFRDTGSVATTSDVTSIGLFFSPHFRLNDLPVDSNGFHIFASFYAEMLWQRVKSSFDYTKTGRDTTYYAPTINAVSQQNYKETSIANDYRSHYFGVGVPIYIKDYDAKNRWRFSIYINPVLGFSTQKFIALQNPLDSGLRHSYNIDNIKNLANNPLTNTFARPSRGWNPFYLFQFRLNEEKIGISFTGEVRGFFLQGSRSIISLSLSKKFDISAFYNSITKSPNSSSAANAAQP